ncbi:hypothetical protein Trydic_g9486 [Trypoxylus dichotomus]
MDNTPYHSRKVENTPTRIWKKADIQNWLQNNGIEYEEDMIRAELLILVNMFENALNPLDITTSQFKPINDHVRITNEREIKLRTPIKLRQRFQKCGIEESRIVKEFPSSTNPPLYPVDSASSFDDD